MLVIPITCDNGLPEWCMVEMQGELERKGACNPDEEYVIGKLSLSSKVRVFTVSPPMRVGFHIAVVTSGLGPHC